MKKFRDKEIPPKSKEDVIRIAFFEAGITNFKFRKYSNGCLEVQLQNDGDESKAKEILDLVDSKFKKVKD